MAPPPRQDGWQYYTHHRRATIAEWDAGETLRNTANGGDAQYNPHIYSTHESIRELELHCILDGKIIRETPNKLTAFMKLDVVVGACSGQYTPYVFAECTSGFYHGRPMCEDALRKIGASI
jgi:hypothetical protein